MKKLLLSALAIGSFAGAQAQLWMPVDANIDTTVGIRYMSAVNANTVWAIGYDGNVPARTFVKFTRTVDGNTFVGGSFYADTNTYSPSNISAVNDTVAFIAAYAKAGDGTPGQILKTTDGGATWNNVADALMFNSTANFPNIVHFWDLNNGWTQGDPNNTNGSGNEFEIWRTNDGGTSWARVNGANIPNPLSGEYGTVDVYTTYGDHHIWYGTNKGRVFRSADTGATWQAAQLTGMAGGVYGLAFRDSLHGMVWGAATTAATPAIVFRVTTDGGATWTALNTSTTGVDIGWSSIDNIPGTDRYMSVGVNVPRSQYVTSVTYDDGLTWNVLEGGLTNAERMIELEVIDANNAWGGNFSDNVLPFGMGGMNKYTGPDMATIGLKPVAETNNYAIYPNPSKGVVTLRLDKALRGTEVKVMDVMGKVVYATTLKVDYIKQELTLDLSSLPTGVYMMVLNGGKNNEVKKLIIE